METKAGLWETMRIEVKHPGGLTGAERAGWRALAQGEALSSPCFTPEFNEIAGEVHKGVRVALVQEGERLTAVFPFRRGPLGFCLPPAGALTDFQGLIAAPDARFDIREIARRTGVRVFAYEALPADQARHGFPGAADIDGCAVIGLEDGFDVWLAGRKAATGAIKRLEASRRALERAHGPVRVMIEETSDAAFDTLIAWKRAQLRAAGHFDIFEAPATRALLDRIRTRTAPEFRGVLSALYAGDTLAAAHFGMQAGCVLHYWFPAYDPAFAKFSPGNLLLLELARAGAAQGWTAIHLGAGAYGYKREFASRQIPLMRGVLRTPSLAAVAHRIAQSVARAAEAAPLGPLSPLPGKALRKAGRIADFGWRAV